MPDIKKPVKEVAVYDGSSWDRYDIGAKAENVSLSNINIGTNVNSAFNTLIGSNTLTDGKIVITDNQQHIMTSNVNSSLLGGLSDTTIIENQGTLDNNVIIKKLKQNGTNNIICPESKTSAIYMSDNETTLDNYLGTIANTIGDTDISSIGNGTITGAIGDTDISSIGNGTITGAIGELNDKIMAKQLVVELKSLSTITLTANGSSNEYGKASGNIVKTGYTPLAIVSITKAGAGSGRAALSGHYISGNEANVTYINTGKTTITVGTNVYILYKKSQ